MKMADDNLAHRPLTVVVVGLGQMGLSHLRAYHANPGYQVVGVLSRTRPTLPRELSQYEDCILTDLDSALILKPDVVSVNTHTSTHASYAIAALNAGAHVFVEKPLAVSIAEARTVVEAAKKANKKLVVGYILRHHPSWTEFICQARNLGPPFVMRMNLNQRSTGEAWRIHKTIMETTSPIVDCGVHYVDVMLQITDAQPVQVHGIGARLSDEIALDQVNYGHLQITFDDGSVGWYEAGWGPMISETAHFVKDIMTPRGSVSIIMDEGKGSADVASHTKTSLIRVANISGEEQMFKMNDEPTHDELCAREQNYLLSCIREDRDLAKHMEDAVRSLGIVLAADRSMRENRAINVNEMAGTE